jgi:hypothetical protein
LRGKRVLVLLLSIGVASLLASCVSTLGGYSVEQTVKPQSIMIATQGVTIAAEDGSFTLRSGVPAAVPFMNATNGIGIHGENAPIIDLYKEAWANKWARKVTVAVPGREKPLYGLLLLSMVFADGVGPATRSYQITIPETYIAAASGGRISVVYEKYNVKSENSTVDSPWGTTTLVPKNWVLWLSDMPFDVGL